MKKNRGSVTIFLTILLVPMLIISGVFVDVGRYQLAKAYVSNAADLTLRSNLANYDSALKEVYGLFAISQKAQGNDANALYSEYFKDNLGMNQEKEYMDFLKLYLAQNEDGSEGLVSINGIEQSSLAEANMLKQQIVEYMKYRAPINAGLSLLDCFSSLKKLKPQSNVVTKKATVDEKNADFAKACQDYWDAIKKYEDDVSESSLNEWKSSYLNINGQYKKAYLILEALIKLDESYQSIASSFHLKEDYNLSKLDIFDTSKDNEFKNAYKDITENKTISELDYDAAYAYLDDAIHTYKDHVNSLHVQEFSWIVSGTLTDDDVFVLSNASSKFNDTNKNKYHSYLTELRSICSLYSEMNKKFTNKKDDIQSLTKEDLRENNRTKIFVSMMISPKKMLKEMKQKVQDMSDYATELFKSCNHILDTIIKDIDEAIDKGEKVKKKAKEINDANQDFSDSIKSYNSKSGEDEFSANMNQVYESNKSSFDEEKVNDLKKQLDDFKSSAESMRTAYKESKYAGNKVIDTISNIYDKHVNFNQSMEQTVQILAFPQIELKKPDGDFYQYLKSAFENKKDDSDSKKAKNDIVDTANKMKDNSQSTTDIPERSIGESSDLPSKGGASSAISISGFDLGKEFSNFFGGIGGIFNCIGDLIADPSDGFAAMRDDLYVINYAMNNFSYYTQEKELKKNKDETDKVPKTFSGVAINANTNLMYQGEIEYMLYGKDTVKENVEAAKGNIFAIRLAINTIFALTDSDINTVTSSIAGAASFFMIPPIVIQVILDISLGLAETSIDLMRLENGEKIELFKSKDSFICNPLNANNLSTLSTFLKEKTKDKIVEVSENVKNQLNGSVTALIDNSMKNIKITTDDYVNDVRVAITKSLKEQSNSLLESIRIRAQGVIENALLKDLDKESFKNNINNGFDNVAEELKGSLSNFQDLSENIDLSTLIETELNNIKSSINAEIDKIDITNNLSDLKNKTFNIINNRISVIINNITSKITIITNDSVNKLSEKIKSKVGDVIDTSIDGTRDYVLEATDKSFDELFPTKSKELNLSGQESGKNSALKNAFKMGYSNYLELFFFGKLNTDDELVMERMADIIQLNLRKGNSDENSEIFHFKPSANFKMSEAFTYAELHTDLGMKTIFIGLDWFKEKTSKEKQSFNFKFKSILGYS